MSDVSRLIRVIIANALFLETHATPKFEGTFGGPQYESFPVLHVIGNFGWSLRSIDVRFP